VYVLGIETATSVASIAIAGKDAVLSECMINEKRMHSINLLPMIENTFKSAGIEPAQLDGIAVSIGPGSFTGLRIGIAVAKMLSCVWNIPIAPVSILQAMAYQLYGCKDMICPMISARRNEVYTAVYTTDKGQMVNIQDPVAVSIEQIASILNDKKGNVVFLGDAIELYRHYLINTISDKIEFEFNTVIKPSAASIALLGTVELKQGRGVLSVNLKPEYIRLSQAEVKWNEKNKFVHNT